MSTREKIIFAAVNLFIKQGIARTTTREIAAAASVSEGSIYRYFPSKEELAWQVFNDYHQTLALKLEQAAENKQNLHDKVDALVTCFLTMADENWLMFKYYLTSQYTHMHKVEEGTQTPYKVVNDLINSSIDVEVMQDESINILCAMLMGSVHQIGINKIHGRISGELSPHKYLVTETIYRMLVNEKT